tara:strand:+ start:1940 stop:3430 length:1491 start_codon:yes stop_codon:yes gene_type:complete
VLFTELIEIMSSNGVKSLAGIARELKVSPQSVSNWKARNRVPYKYVLEIQNRFIAQSNGHSSNVKDNLKIKEDFSKQSLPSSNPLEELLPPFLNEEKSDFSLADFLMPIAQNLRYIVKSTIFMTIFGILIFLISTLLSFFSQEEPEIIYVTSAKIVIPGGISIPGGGGGSASGILGKLGINMPSSGGGGGPAPTSTLTSPKLYPEFLRTRSFAKRLLSKKFQTKKYGEQTLLEIVLREEEEKLNEPSIFGSKKEIILDRSQGLDTLVMQYMGVLSDTSTGMGMIQFSQEGPFQTITTRAIEPQLAVEIAYVVLDELQAFTEYFTRVDLDKTQNFIEQRLEVVQDEYESLEEEMKKFRETNRQVTSPALMLQQERLTRDLGIYKGIYTTLYQNLEQVKIQKEYEFAPTIEILDYPIAPLGPHTIRQTSTTQNPVLIVLLGIVGFGFAVVMSLAKGYFATVDGDEKVRLKGVVEEAKQTLNSIFKSRKKIKNQSSLGS